jgi:hypothetical protein
MNLFFVKIAKERFHILFSQKALLILLKILNKLLFKSCYYNLRRPDAPNPRGETSGIAPWARARFTQNLTPSAILAYTSMLC